MSKGSPSSSSSGSPEPLNLLIESLPAKELLRFIKRHEQFSHAVFQGFSPREKSLSLPVVSQRLEPELLKQPLLVKELYAFWMDYFRLLMKQINDPDFSPNPQIFRSLSKKYGNAALRYGLLHAERKELHSVSVELTAELIPAGPAKTHLAVAIPDRSRERMQEKIETIRKQLQSVEAERNSLRTALAGKEKQIAELNRQQSDMQKKVDATAKSLEREQRRVKKAEEELQLLSKALRQQNKLTPPATVPSEIVNSLTEAIDILQRGLSAAYSNTSLEEKSKPTPQIIGKPVPATVRKSHAGNTITLQTNNGKQTYAIPNILAGLRKNDGKLLAQIRDGIARISKDPVRERALTAELTKAGIPITILTGPLRPAVVDGSNVANINAESPRARIEYLHQIWRSAWREGYFPVIVIVDASLRHQIDNPGQLMDMVEREEIIMAPAGTSADEMLIEETVRNHAVLITNDRMTDWPAAKELEKRHVEFSGGNASVGQFQRTDGLWFY